MKTKRNLLVAALVLLMMVTAVGYAAWSDTLEVNGTVATGTFDVQFEDISSNSLDYTDGYEGTFNATTGAQVSTNPDDPKDFISISISNAKPGETFTIPVTVVNKGTVNAVFDGIDAAVSPTTVGATTEGFVPDADDEYKFTNGYFIIELCEADGTTPFVPTDLTKTGTDDASQSFKVVITANPNSLTSGDTLMHSADFNYRFNYSQQGD